MQEKQVRIMVVLAALLLAMVALIVLVEPPDEAAGEGEPAYEKLFPDLDAASIAEISIESGGSSTASGGSILVLDRTDDGWKLTSPVQAVADARRVDRLAEAIATVEATEDLLGPDSRDPEPFGLGSTASTVTLTLADGGSRVLRLGRDSPVGGHSYVAVGEEDAVRSSRTRLSTSIATNPDEYRTREVVRFTRSEVDEVRIESAAGSILLSRDDHGWWVSADGGGAERADPDQVDAMLDGLADLRVNRFLQPDEAPPPVASTTVRLREDEASQTLVFGPPAGDEVTATVPLQSGPVLLDDTLRASLAATGAAWLSDELIVIRPITLTSLEVELDGVRFSGERGDDGWEPASAEDLLAVLRRLEADRQTDVPAPAGAPTGRIVLTEDQGRAETVAFHQSVDGGRVAIDAAGGGPFFVADQAIADLAAALP